MGHSSLQMHDGEDPQAYHPHNWIVQLEQDLVKISQIAAELWRFTFFSRWRFCCRRRQKNGRERREGKEREGITQLGYISAIWGADHLGPISTKIGRVGGASDVIILSSFCFNIFRGFISTGGQNFHLPIDFAGDRYNSVAATAQHVKLYIDNHLNCRNRIQRLFKITRSHTGYTSRNKVIWKQCQTETCYRRPLLSTLHRLAAFWRLSVIQREFI